MGYETVKKETIIELASKKAGVVSAVAQACGVSRQAINYRKLNDPEIAQAFEDARESVLDMAETELFRRINGGDITAIIFTLKTIGKQRGYIEKTEFKHSGSMNQDIKIIKKQAKQLLEEVESEL